MKEIPLQNSNQKVIVDDVWFEAMNKYKWSIYADGYAQTKNNIRMHRIIAGTPKGMETDHINRNKLDNRSENLRICTQHENQINRGRPINNTSGYKGVDFHNKKWRAKIEFRGKVITLGCFENIIEAAQKYDEKAKELFGEFAYLNLNDTGGVIPQNKSQFSEYEACRRQRMHPKGK